MCCERMKEDRKRIKALGGRGICPGVSALLGDGEKPESGAGVPGFEEKGDFLVDALVGMGVARETEAGVVFRLRLLAGWLDGLAAS